ncbi:glycosyltransferase involved in cell wall biosynthesis [Glaciihabitans tibetensis]|uniref:D-inositol 3-phosphate glycosyltransferase n=1 Tax=Glaciihabitans tibetensis TaxID=1266600 RepID=A0A2T0V3B0_9MICO|nr:glycosyltransferase [Glaciihabitans tibetensis]PRY64663.1 glycosyltransferase involved in cell wall biosynthesis [Glaciihabitans tibetensis]
MSPSFARREGGPSEVLRGLLPALSKRDVSWQVATTDKGALESDEDFASLSDVRVFSSRILPSWTFSAGMVIPLREMISHADIVHIHSIHTFPTTVTMLLCRIMRVPYVLEPHGALDRYHLGQRGWKKRIYTRTIDRFGLKRLAAVVYSSDREESDGRSFLPGVVSTRMTLGVAPNLLSLEAADRDQSMVLFLGRVTEKKRVDLLIRAMSHAAMPEHAELVIAGPVDTRLQYDPQALAVELGVGHRVRFLGQVDSAARASLLSRASVFVLASEDESFGMAVAEALAVGCAVACSKHVGIAHEAERAGGAVIIDLDPDDIARKVARLLDDDHYRNKISQAGQSLARRRFTWDEASTDAVSLYQSVLADSWPKRQGGTPR